MSEWMVATLTVLGVALFVFMFYAWLEHDEWYVDSYRWVVRNHGGKKKYGFTYAQINGLSGRSKRLLINNNALPEANRLGPEILDTLRAYDVKNGGAKKVDDHFHYGNCYCYRDCSMSDYVSLGSAIDNISAAVKSQREAIAAAAVAGISNNMPFLIERANEEARILNETTKELT